MESKTFQFTSDERIKKEKISRFKELIDELNKKIYLTVESEKKEWRQILFILDVENTAVVTDFSGNHEGSLVIEPRNHIKILFDPVQAVITITFRCEPEFKTAKPLVAASAGMSHVITLKQTTVFDDNFQQFLIDLFLEYYKVGFPALAKLYQRKQVAAPY